jgi:hypothetical protein
LAKAGVSLSVAALVEGAGAAPAPPLLGSTAKAALLVVTGRALLAGTVPARVLTLTEEVQKAMLLSKVKTIWAVVVALSVGIAYQVLAQPGPRVLETASVPVEVVAQDTGRPAPAPPKVPKDLLQKRLASARKVFELNLARLKTGQGLPAELFGWSERWLEAELALADKQAERVKALKDHLNRTREVERVAVGHARTGQGRQADAEAATYYRLEAEIRLFKAGVPTNPAEK